MKNSIIIFLVIFPMFCIASSFSHPESGKKKHLRVLQDSLKLYKDGCYAGTSQGGYIYEPYWGIVSLNVENGHLTSVKFIIRDSSLHEAFDGNYERHFANNPIYIQQSRNDWAGVKAYPGRLVEKQDTDKLDAISGATWSYNIFRASVTDALKKEALLPDTASRRGE
jgi:uncharacterized protein with FMN-binding domain